MPCGPGEPLQRDRDPRALAGQGPALCVGLSEPPGRPLLQTGLHTHYGPPGVQTQGTARGKFQKGGQLSEDQVPQEAEGGAASRMGDVSHPCAKRSTAQPTPSFTLFHRRWRTPQGSHFQGGSLQGRLRSALAPSRRMRP